MDVQEVVAAQWFAPADVEIDIFDSLFLSQRFNRVGGREALPSARESK